MTRRADHTNPYERPDLHGIDCAKWCRACGGWFPEWELIESPDGSAYVHPDDGPY